MSAQRTDHLCEGQVVQVAIVTRTVTAIRINADGTRDIRWSPAQVQPLVPDLVDQGTYHQARLWITSVPAAATP